MLIAIIVAILLVRNLPLALRPLFAPPAQRDLRRAVVPMITVVLALVVLALVMTNPKSTLISWPGR